MQKITAFLMFDGTAEAAMNFYVSLFADSGIKSISRYGENELGSVGTVWHSYWKEKDNPKRTGRNDQTSVNTQLEPND